MGGISLPIYSRRYDQAHRHVRNNWRSMNLEDVKAYMLKYQRLWAIRHRAFRRFYLRNRLWLHRHKLPSSFKVFNENNITYNVVHVVRDVDEYLQAISLKV